MPTPYAEQTWSAAEKELVDLQQNIWDLMAAKDADALRPIFHPEAMFVHMGGYWGTEQELRAIGDEMKHIKGVVQEGRDLPCGCKVCGR